MGAPNETSMGGLGRGFPSTHWSIVCGSSDLREPLSKEALDELCRRYWKPVYAFLRSARSLTNEESKDATQSFFVELLEGGLLQRYREDRGSFRGYLRGALRFFLTNAHDRDVALKRGGGRKPLSLDQDVRIEESIASGETPEETFDRQWARSVVEQAVEDLREELLQSGRESQYRVFERHDLEPPAAGAPSYADTAQEMGLHESDVTNYLHRCRLRLKKGIEDRVREYVDDPADFPGELAHILASLGDSRLP